MKHAWTTLVVAHAVAATYALIFGAFNLLRKRKGDKPHRMIGFIWLGSMYFVIISSFWIQMLRLGSFSWIHGLSVFTFFTISLGLLAAIKHNIRSHKFFMMGSYFGLLGALIGVVAVPSRLIPQMIMNDTVKFSLIVIVIALSALFSIIATFYLAKPPKANN